MLNIILFLFIVIIIFFIVNNFLNKSEYFSNNSNNIQSGNGTLNGSGTITFQQPFINIPSVFTQANNNSNNSIIINTGNITNTGFSYIKNSISESSAGSFTTLVMEEDTIDTFNWIAVDTTNINNITNNPSCGGNSGNNNSQNCCSQSSN
jgi:hypothetical protein